MNNVFDGYYPDNWNKQLLFPFDGYYPDNWNKQLLFSFDGYYPDNWNKQLLFPFEKKGHSINEPKLRGIAIGPALSRLYDILINNIFRTWYHPNMHQAGFREKQGRTLQIVAFLHLLDMAQKINKTLYIFLLDYEKAFDFTNRAEMAKQLMQNNIGDRYLQNFKNMYTDTSYIPRISNNEIGEEINTEYGMFIGEYLFVFRIRHA